MFFWNKSKYLFICIGIMKSKQPTQLTYSWNRYVQYQNKDCCVKINKLLLLSLKKLIELISNFFLFDFLLALRK